MPEEANRRRYPAARGFLFHLLHHALLATTIAAVTLALDTTRTFADLDMETRAFVTRRHAESQDSFREEIGKKGFQSRFDVDAAGERPLVLYIVSPVEAARYRDQTLHQFYGELIRALADKQPRLVAIDVRLDPGIDHPILQDPRLDVEKLRSQAYLPGGDIVIDPNSLPPTTRDRMAGARRVLQELDRALADRQVVDEALKYAAERTRLVLTAPPLPRNALALVQFNVDGSDPDKLAFEKQIQWMRRMCALPNVEIAVRVLPPRSILTEYDRGSMTLGNVATAALKATPQSAGTQSAAKDGAPNDASDRASVCSIVRTVKEEPGRRGIEKHERLIEQLSRLYPADARANQAAFNPDFFETLSYFAPLDLQLAPPERDTAFLLPPRLTQKVVFVGDGVPRARVLLDLQISDAEMHAAMLYSNQNAIGTSSHAAVFAVDVAIGTLLGFLFTWSWGVYVRASDRMIDIPITDGLTKFRSWIWARLVLLPANLLLLAGLIAATWWLSNELLRLGSWINPLPLVIGMSLKGLLSSRQRHVGHLPGSFKDLLTTHPDMVWQPVVIIVALGVFVFAH